MSANDIQRESTNLLDTIEQAISSPDVIESPSSIQSVEETLSLITFPNRKSHIDFMNSHRLIDLDKKISDKISECIPIIDSRSKQTNIHKDPGVALIKLQCRIRTLIVIKQPDCTQIERWTAAVCYLLDLMYKSHTDLSASATKHSNPSISISSLPQSSSTANNLGHMSTLNNNTKHSKARGRHSKDNSTAVHLQDRPQRFVVSTVQDIVEMYNMMELSISDRHSITVQLEDRKRLLEDVRHICGFSGYQFNMIQPSLDFISAVFYIKQPSYIVAYFERIVMVSVLLDTNPQHHMKKLIVVSTLDKKYNSNSAKSDRDSKHILIESLLKHADSMIHQSMSSGIMLEDKMDLIVMSLESLQPTGSNLSNKLAGLTCVINSDFKELIRIKQSLNLSDPKDILYDILLDLVRFNQSRAHQRQKELSKITTNQNHSHHQLPPVSIPLLHHKLSNQLLTSVLTPAYLLSVRVLFPNVSPSLVLLSASIFINTQDNGVLRVLMESVNNWVQDIRNSIKSSNIECMKEEARTLLSIIRLDKILELAQSERAKKKCSRSEDAAVVIKACARISYIGFYVFRLLEDHEKAIQMIERLFELGQDVCCLWSIQIESSDFFLDLLTTIIEIHKNGEKEGLEDSPLTISLKKFLCVISATSHQDTDQVKAYKSLIIHSIEMNFPEDETLIPKPAYSLNELLSINSLIPRDSLLSCLRLSICNVSVYYQYFMNISLDAIDEGANSILKLMVNIYEEFKKNTSQNQIHTENDIAFSLLCQRYLDWFMKNPEQANGTDFKQIFKRVAFLLYNCFVQSREFSVLKNSMIYILLSYSDGVMIIGDSYSSQGSQKGTIEEQLLDIIQKLDVWDDNTRKIMLAFCFEFCKKEERTQGDSLLSMKLLEWVRNYIEMTSEPETNIKKSRLTQMQEEEVECMKELLPPLTETQSLYLEFSLLYHYKKEAAIQWISDLINGSCSHIKFSNPQSLAPLFLACKLLNNPQITCQLLRVLLRTLLANNTVDYPSVLSVYSSLISSSDTTKDIKMYINQLSGVIDMHTPDTSNNTTHSSIHKVILTLGKVLDDYQSIKDVIVPLARKIEDKYSFAIKDIKPIEYVLHSIKRLNTNNSRS